MLKFALHRLYLIKSNCSSIPTCRLKDLDDDGNRDMDMVGGEVRVLIHEVMKN